MKNKRRGPMTEPMFYILMAFLNQDMCGIDIAEHVNQRTGGRVQLGPGTLYTILSKLQEEGLIKEIAIDGRKRTYRLTALGKDAFLAEVERLEKCLRDGREAAHEKDL